MPSYVFTLVGKRLFFLSEYSLMRLVNASTVWRRQGRDISSPSSLRRLPLDFQCPVSLSSLSEEVFKESLLLRRLRRDPSESELEGSLSGEPRLSRFLLCSDLDESSLGEQRRPNLSRTLRFPSLEWTLARLSLSS